MSEEVEFWTHYCRREQADISTEKGHECNWCGEREEDEEV